MSKSGRARHEYKTPNQIALENLQTEMRKLNDNRQNDINTAVNIAQKIDGLSHMNMSVLAAAFFMFFEKLNETQNNKQFQEEDPTQFLLEANDFKTSFYEAIINNLRFENSVKKSTTKKDLMPKCKDEISFLNDIKIQMIVYVNKIQDTTQM
jgi:hypothetical protein